MEKPLRILHLEDEPDFVALVTAVLIEDGLKADLVRVDTLDAFANLLRENSFDLILADYSLPSCNGIQALELVREKDAHTPFVLISGTIGEQAAIESLRSGATDYVLKNKLERLAPTVRRAVLEAEERSQRKRAETELVRREKYFRTLTEHSLDVRTILSREGLFQYNSPSLKTVLGYEPKSVAGHNAFGFVHPDDVSRVKDTFQRALQNPEQIFTQDFRFHHTDGS